MIQEYVCGFMFDQTYQNVALIEKVNPSWQRGFLNGVGGKIEKDESPINAMVREFKEEAGVDTTIETWTQYAKIVQNNSWHVYFFMSVGDLSLLKSMEKEQIVLLAIKDLQQSKALQSVKWLVPLCMDKTHSYTLSEYTQPSKAR